MKVLLLTLLMSLLGPGLTNELVYVGSEELSVRNLLRPKSETWKTREAAAA